MGKIIVYTKEKGKIETDNGADFIGLTWHRLDVPAYQKFNRNGQVAYEVYYINGVGYTKFGYDTEIFKMKLALL